MLRNRIYYQLKPFIPRALRSAVRRRIALRLEARVQERTAELRQANAGLHEADQRKDHFLAVLAHELRNPLGAILSAAQVIDLDHAGRSGVEESRDVILRQGRHMTRGSW